jgi:acyl carrier protein
MSGLSRVSALQEFVKTKFGKSVTPDQPILGEVVDSLGIFSLVEFIETTFGVMIAETDLTSDNLSSLKTIDQLIGRLKRPNEPMGS